AGRGNSKQLTFVGLGKTSAMQPRARVVRFPRKRVIWSIAGAAAAVIVAVAIYWPTRARAPKPGHRPTLSMDTTRPIVLAKALLPMSGGAADPNSRPARVSGAILSIENGEATV